MYIGYLNDNGMRNLLDSLVGKALDWAGTHSSNASIVFEDGTGFRLRFTCAEPVMQPGEVLPADENNFIPRWEFMFAGVCSTEFMFTNSDNGKVLLEMQNGELIQLSSNASNCCGLELYFKADPLIYKELQLDYDFYANRFQEMAYLHPEATITFKDNRKARHDYRVFHYPEGIKKQLEQLQQSISLYEYPVHYFEAGETDAMYRFAFSVRYWSDTMPVQKSFVNDQLVYANGSLTEGFFNTLKKALRIYAGKQTSGETYTFSRKNLKRQLALIACFSGDEKDVNYEGPTKRKLASPVLQKTAERYALPLLTEWLDNFPQEAALLLEMNAADEPE